MIYRSESFSMTLNDPNPEFKATPIFNTKYLSNDTKYTHLGIQLITSKTLHTPYSSLQFQMTWNDVQ